MACHILLESSWQGLQLCFRPHIRQRSTHKVMALQSCKSPHLGVLGQNDIWVLVLWLGTKYTIRGKVVASPKSRPWWVLWIHVCPWLVLAPKAIKLRTNQLVVWFMQVHVSSWCLSFFVVLISELQHAPLPPKCYEPGSVPQLLIVSSFYLRLTFESIKELGSSSTPNGRQMFFNIFNAKNTKLSWNVF